MAIASKVYILYQISILEPKPIAIAQDRLYQKSNSTNFAAERGPGTQERAN